MAVKNGLLMHLDGARLFNACVATGLSAADYAQHFETVSFCLSKGLGAPVGSLLAGSREIVRTARRWRKVLGGGMRQVGILAAAGLYALKNNIERLALDHENAQILAQGLADIDGLTVNPSEVDTNIVIFKLIKPGLSPRELTTRLAEQGCLMLPFGPDRVRAVTHLDVDTAAVKTAVGLVRGAVR
jgi:threonine aldolase